MTEMCSTCGLPHELCICKEIIKESISEVFVTIESRSHGNQVTLIENIPEIEIDDVETDLKSNLGCGGTIKDNTIELQGNHLEDVKEYLLDNNYEVVSN